MLQLDTLRHISRYVVGASALLASTAFAFGGFEVGIGAVVGGCFAILNWFVMRWLGRRLLVANSRGRVFAGLLLAAKMAVALGVVTAIFATRAVHPIGFTIGFSGLIIGIIGGVLHATSQRTSSTSPTEGS